MAQDKGTTPPDFSELVTQWERNFNEMSNQLMGTDEFSKSMNQFQNMQMEFQRNFSEVMARQLANFNIPSRDDIIAVAEQIREMDRRLSRIESALEKTNTGFTASEPPRKGPARTRKPPSQRSKESGQEKSS